MAWPSPGFSRSEVKRAGIFLRDNDIFSILEPPIDDEKLKQFFHYNDVMSNWRAAHGAVLNTSQAWLRRLGGGIKPVVGQRLKRSSTILDKLIQGRSVDLATMHDIAGVRTIFETEEQLMDFRESIVRSRATHERTHSPDKFDYISNPKTTGYRGVHEVFKRQGVRGADWNGLRFEVQLRTATQHAWATAVEIYDITQSKRFKFEADDDPAYEQFRIVSEMFARVHENRAGCLPEMSDTELKSACRKCERKTGLIATVRSLRAVEDFQGLEKNSILLLTNENKLFVKKFSSFSYAMAALPAMEKDEGIANVVLVGANTPTHIRNAFRNYFSDATDFIRLYDAAIKAIG